MTYLPKLMAMMTLMRTLLVRNLAIRRITESTASSAGAVVTELVRRLCSGGQGFAHRESVGNWEWEAGCTHLGVYLGR